MMALVFYGIEAHVQWIAEPYVPRLVTLDRHLTSLRAYVASLNGLSAFP